MLTHKMLTITTLAFCNNTAMATAVFRLSEFLDSAINICNNRRHCQLQLLLHDFYCRLILLKTYVILNMQLASEIALNTNKCTWTWCI